MPSHAGLREQAGVGEHLGVQRWKHSGRASLSRGAPPAPPPPPPPARRPPLAHGIALPLGTLTAAPCPAPARLCRCLTEITSPPCASPHRPPAPPIHATRPSDIMGLRSGAWPALAGLLLVVVACPTLAQDPATVDTCPNAKWKVRPDRSRRAVPDDGVPAARSRTLPVAQPLKQRPPRAALLPDAPLPPSPCTAARTCPSCAATRAPPRWSPWSRLRPAAAT